ncbi:MAG: haloacid dehalogenase-like hydrolase [Patescibacteria group bacterium]
MSNKITISCYDVDNTIVRGYTQKYFINYLFKNRIISFKIRFLGVTWFLFYKIGLVSDLYKPMNFLLNFLKGYSIEKYNNFFDDFFQKCIVKNIYNDAILNIKKDINGGARVILISTSLEPIIIRIAKYLNVKDVISTKISFNNSICRGTVNGKIIDGVEKVNFLVDYIKKLGLSRDVIYTSFYSDSYRDLALLNFVDDPHVVNPDNQLLRMAKLNNWPVVHFN